MCSVSCQLGGEMALTIDFLATTATYSLCLNLVPWRHWELLAT